MKKVILISAFLATVFSVHAFAEPQNFINQEVMKQISGVEGRIFEGHTPDGGPCSVLLKLGAEPASTKVPFHSGYKTLNLLSTNSILPKEVEVLETQDDLYSLLSTIQEEGFFSRLEVAGTCSVCGSSFPSVKMAGNQKSTIAFYNPAFTPSHTMAKVKLNQEGDAIKSVTLYEFKDWYLPLIQWSPKKTIFACTID